MGNQTPQYIPLYRGAGFHRLDQAHGFSPFALRYLADLSNQKGYPLHTS